MESDNEFWGGFNVCGALPSGGIVSSVFDPVLELAATMVYVSEFLHFPFGFVHDFDWRGWGNNLAREGVFR